MTRMLYVLIAVAFISLGPFMSFIYFDFHFLERGAIWLCVCLSIFIVVPRVWFGSSSVYFKLPSKQTNDTSIVVSRQAAIAEAILVGLLAIVDFAINVAAFRWSYGVIPIQILAAFWVSSKIMLTQVSISLHSKRMNV